MRATTERLDGLDGLAAGLAAGGRFHVRGFQPTALLGPMVAALIACSPPVDGDTAEGEGEGETEGDPSDDVLRPGLDLVHLLHAQRTAWICNEAFHERPASSLAPAVRGARADERSAAAASAGLVEAAAATSVAQTAAPMAR